MNKQESGLEQAPRAMNLDDIFVRDIMLTATGLLKKQMITGHNLKIAMLTLVNILSAKVNKPMGIMLAASDFSVGMKILKQCMLLAPEDAYRERELLKNEELFGDASELRGKAIISFDASGFAKAWGHLEKMLTMGYAIHTEVMKSDYGPSIRPHRADFWVSMVGIIPDMKDKRFNHPSILKVPLHVDEYPSSRLLGQYQDGRQVDLETEVATVRLRETLARLRPMAVNIPFSDMLFDAIKSANPSDPEKKMEVVLKTLAICTIINNPDQVSKDEIIARIYRININKLSQLKAASSAGQNSAETLPMLTATKLDYYHTWLLMNDMIPVKEISLSDRQINVFEAVKRWNLGRMNTQFDPTNPVKQLSQISTGPSFWSRRENVFEMLNKRGTEEVSQSTIYNELQYLMKEGLVAEGKYPKSSQKGYYVTTFQAGQKIQLPHPSEIICSTFEGEKVQVVNPLTGETETI
ncbi:MAG: hypothetical protein WCJ37_11435 [Syntrophus sp. (in: bacteria)]